VVWTADSLIDREREMSALREVLFSYSADSAHLAVVEGPAGIGKTSLLRLVCQEARNCGMAVLTARGLDLETDLPFAVVRHLLEQFPPRRRATIAGSEWPDLARRIISDPAWRPVPGHGPAMAGMLYGLYWWLVEQIGTTEILIAVDDAQWCDKPSLEYLAYLAHRMEGTTLRLLLGTRSGAASPHVRALIDGVKRQASCRVITLRPLDLDGVRRLVAMGLPTADEGFTAECLRLTGGNPFLLTEVVSEVLWHDIEPSAVGLRESMVGASESVRAATAHRLASLPRGAAELARATAVLADGADARTAAKLAGLDLVQLPELLDVLVEAHILQDSPQLGFVHPLVRRAVLTSMGPGRRAEFHRRAAILFDHDDGDERVAVHLLGCLPAGDSWVVERLREAAARANGCGSPEIAVRYLTRALEEPPEATELSDVLLEMGEAEARAGQGGAVQRLQAAVELAKDPLAKARATVPLTRALFMSGRLAQAVSACESAIVQLDGVDPELALVLECEILTAARQDASTRAVAMRRLPAIAAANVPMGQAGSLLLANLAIEEAIRPGSRQKALDLAERALRGGHLLQADSVATLPLAVLTLSLCGEQHRALLVWDEVIAAQRRQGDTRALALSSAMRGYAAFYTGDLATAVTDIRTGLALVRDDDSQYMTDGYGTAWLAYALIETGEHASAEKELARHAHLLGPSAPFTASYLLSARGHLHLAMNRFDEACADLQECGRRADLWDVHGPALCRWRAPYALALHSLGRHRSALAVARGALEEARAWGALHVIAETERTLGVVLGGDRGGRLLRQAVDTAQSADSPLEQAKALLALAQALRKSGDKSAARAPLREAVDLAARCGATFVLDQAQRELLATGARPRRLRSTGVTALTTTERRVGELAAEGLTNREIAQLLFVSEKTVETHMRNCFRKLGVGSRLQLRSAFGDQPSARAARRQVVS
jgi:DNA-binding CsgD family transcriptional regulator